MLIQLSCRQASVSKSLKTRAPQVFDDILVLTVNDVGRPKELATCLSLCKEVTLRVDMDDVGSRIFRRLFDNESREELH